MANADLRSIRANGFDKFRCVSLDEGFPEPWGGSLLPAYHAIVARHVFYPALHGFTHFNVQEFMKCLSDNTPRGELARDLISEGVPYLASVTPEFSFALVVRDGREYFLEERDQADWIAAGVNLFVRCFGFSPRSTCAPGYRADETTFRLWAKEGIEAVQMMGRNGLSRSNDIVLLERNVQFEPVLHGEEAPSCAIAQAEAAVARGLPVVVCSHSINYISRYLGRAEHGRKALKEFGERLLQKYPNIRFASDAELIDGYRDVKSGWFRAPTAREFAERLRAVGYRE
jgi:hypothetical protein